MENSMLTAKKNPAGAATDISGTFRAGSKDAEDTAADSDQAMADRLVSTDCLHLSGTLVGFFRNPRECVSLHLVGRQVADEAALHLSTRKRSIQAFAYFIARAPIKPTMEPDLATQRGGKSC